MKKIFIGLLIVGAAAAGVYYFLQTKNSSSDNPVQKKELIGQWKLDTLIVAPKDSATGLITTLTSMIDSSFRNYRYAFQEKGQVVSLKDFVATDTSYYEWDKTSLLLKESASDSTAESFHVIKLNHDSLVLQATDSSSFFFSKTK